MVILENPAGKSNDGYLWEDYESSIRRLNPYDHTRNNRTKSWMDFKWFSFQDFYQVTEVYLCLKQM